MYKIVRITVRCFFIVLVIAGALGPRVVSGTPLYGARSGRTCDNCHLTPNNWENPALKERKCTLSCQGCHVDPAGGGARNASGRFYGQATLPMIASSPRPTRDWDRSFLIGRRDRATTYSDKLPLGPATFADAAAYRDSTNDLWAFGRPLGSDTPYALMQGRYGNLDAAPLLRIGWDIRVAALGAGTLLTFPMQGDFPVTLHPLQHVTFLVNTGFRGRASGYSDTFDDSHSPYFREAFLLIHEAPYQVYAKAGRFTPSFGLRLDDHTSSIRRQFELDGSLPETRVTGVEMGAAPNYPFINASWFRMASRTRQPDAFDIFDVDEGWGTAVNAGFRELGWAVGGSLLMRKRPLDEGGDTFTVGAYAAVNPWYYGPKLPLTYQAEYDHGRYHRASGLETTHAAFYQEIDWLFANGINVLAAHDWADPDREVRDDEFHRLQAGLQITPIAGVTLDGRVRALFPTDGGSDADVFVQLRLWN